MANRPRTTKAPARRAAEKSSNVAASETSGAFSRDQQRKQKTEAIVAAAARLIHAKGVSGTSLDDVAEALGVTKPSVYYYVQNKEELVYLCHLRIADHQARAIDIALASDGDGLTRIRTFIENYARFVWSADSGLPRLWQDNSLTPAKRRAVNQEYFHQSNRVVQIIAAARREKTIYPHDPEVVERALVSSILWVPMWYSEKNSRYDQESLLKKLMTLFFKGLSPD